MGSYIPATAAEQQEMLTACGMQTMDDLFAVVPEDVRLKELNLPEGLTELEVTEKMTALAEKNKRFSSVFRGAGAYKHYIPAIVKTITSKEEFVTAYTPYQAEISQGVLQSIFEYQTQMCELMGMDVSNASVYDGATAAAEAVFMCQERKRTTVIVSGAADPQTIELLKTYCSSRNVALTVVPAKNYATDIEALKAALEPTTAAVYIQSPNYFGQIEDAATIIEAAHAAGAKAIMSVNPISMGLMKTPSELGADIAIAEGQPLGMPLSFGGPYLGIMTCKQAMMRKLPGRIVGETVDANGKRCFVLTLQAREQHIRREKASSNICSNQALCAMTASVYLAAMGPDGLKQAAVSSTSHAHYLAAELNKLGFELSFDGPFFNEFLTSCPVDVAKLNEHLAANNILGPLPVEDKLLWCCTELNSKTAMDKLLTLVKEVCA